MRDLEKFSVMCDWISPFATFFWAIKVRSTTGNLHKIIEV